MSARYRQLAAHVRRLPDDDLNDLLVDLPPDRFMALVEGALSHPVNPAGLGVRLVSAAPSTPRRTAVACDGARRRADAVGALAWVTPASGARCMVLAAYVRAMGDLELNDLLVELPVDRFDALLQAAFPAEGAAA